VKRIPVENILEDFTLAVTSGDEKAAWNATNRALSDGLSVVEVCEHIILPSLASFTAGAPCAARHCEDGRVIEIFERVIDRLHPHLPFRAGRRPGALVWVLAADAAERAILEIRARLLADLLGSDGWQVPRIKTDMRPMGADAAPEAVIVLPSPTVTEGEIRKALTAAIGDFRQTRTIIIGNLEQRSLQELNALSVPDEYQARRALKDVEPVTQYLDAGSRDIFEALLRGNGGTATQLVEVGLLRHGRNYLAEILLLPCGENRSMLAYPKQEEVERLTKILNNYNREINKLNGDLREVRGQLRLQSNALDAANAQLGAAYEELNASRLEDPLTGAFNKRYYMVNLVNEINRARRYQRSLGFLLIDVDDFQKINERYGYPAGDEVLRRIVEMISGHIRNGIDWIARVGDEEFVVVLPETDMEGCLRVGEKLRALVASSTVEFDKRHILVTISVGGASYDALQDVPLSFQELTSRAGQALGHAREAGPNNQRIEPIE
jgi:diguanylate cyclase (GGDEF)-like protein